jgi:hypothetical protein
VSQPAGTMPRTFVSWSPDHPSEMRGVTALAFRAGPAVAQQPQAAAARSYAGICNLEFHHCNRRPCRALDRYCHDQLLARASALGPSICGICFE